ncbi:hypothetical protein LDJ79_02815 [Vibrio tritonius]|uniref:Uncharacterized protein n=1 Tax=Vibrio tritonius TaxID=1435069 RepID=A0ABS7YH72_9VIBR|nr:hypothetical protein [Vibrio tritonius]MCA2015025.1 hypothetical protein [Vibrio tritonius]
MINQTNQNLQVSDEKIEEYSKLLSRSSFIAFLATYAYMEFFLNMRNSLVDSLLFVIMGTILNTFCLLPAFVNLRTKWPHLSVLWSICDISITVVVTAAVYYLCFSEELSLIKLLM